MRDAIVVGSGVIGATVAEALKKQGRDVLVLDDEQPLAGSRPSGGHLKPSWFSGMKKADYEPAMELLADVWGMTSEQFKLWPTGIKVTVYRVDTDVLVQTEKTVAHVSSVAHINNYPSVHFAASDSEKIVEERCRLLVLATGVWAGELIPGVQCIAKQGVSFRFAGKVVPFIKPWAPYKQVVAHQQGQNEIWVGDGSAILPQNWTDDRTKQCLERCRGAIKANEKSPLRVLTGLRPYCKTTGGDPCLLQQLGPRAWVATGAGKSGTIAAGWVARRILDANS